VGLDEAVSLELVEAEPWACPVDLDGARSASGLPPRAGIAWALAAGATAADTRAPLPRGAATLVRPGSGRMEPTAIPATPAAINTVILRTTSYLTDGGVRLGSPTTSRSIQMLNKPISRGVRSGLIWQHDVSRVVPQVAVTG
jgi:hypothetical protein